MGMGCNSERRIQKMLRLYEESLHPVSPSGKIDMSTFQSGLMDEHVVDDHSAAQALGDVFLDGIVSGQELERLKKERCLDNRDEAELIRAVGGDGANCLHRHAVWLADKALAKWNRWDESLPNRVAMMQELSALYMMHPKTVVESSFNGVKSLMAEALADQELVLPAISVLGAMGDINLLSLMGFFKDPRREVRLKAIDAVGRMGVVALPAIPALMQVVRDDSDPYVKQMAKQVQTHLEGLRR